MMSLVLAILFSLFCKFYWDLSWLYFSVLVLELFFLFYFLKRFGNRFIFIELLALISITQWLLAPMLMDLMGIQLGVPYDEYYAYVYPGTLFFLLFLTMPLWNQKKLDARLDTIMKQLTIQYGHKHRTAIALFIIGAISWLIQTYVPDSLNYLFYFLAHFLLVAICLFFFTNYSWKGLWILAGLILLVSTTLLNGMIGTVIFWVFIIAMIYTANKPFQIPYVAKILIFVGGLWVLATLQLTKSEYRVETWDIERNEFSSRISRDIKKDPALFMELFFKNFKESSKLLLPGTIVDLSSRLNQGMLISYVISYVPHRRAYGQGEVTFYNSFIAFIPRLFWPKKPIVGQAEYYEKYTGIKLGKYVSSTLGPPGDAYADFGWYGIFFLAFYGLIIGQIFNGFVRASLNSPILLIWFMVIYVVSITVSEISVAGFLNSIVKYLLFIYVIRAVLRMTLKLQV